MDAANGGGDGADTVSSCCEQIRADDGMGRDGTLTTQIGTAATDIGELITRGKIEQHRREVSYFWGVDEKFASFVSFRRKRATFACIVLVNTESISSQRVAHWQRCFALTSSIFELRETSSSKGTQRAYKLCVYEIFSTSFVRVFRINVSRFWE